MGKKLLKRWRKRPLLKRKLGDSDFGIIFLTTALVIFGVVMVFSASYYYSLNNTGSPYGYLRKQTIWALIGFGLMYGFSKLDYHVWRRFSIYVILFSLLLLLLVLTPLGTNVNGATRWIYIGPVSIMPGELAKGAIIVYVAAYYSANTDRVKSFTKGVLPMVVIVAVFCGLIVKQPNLSTAITLAAIVFLMMVVAGLKRFWIILAAAVSAGGAVFIVSAREFLSGSGTYWARRITSFMNPFADAKGDGYQVVQSLLALGTGGLKGLGLGHSIQKNLYLPEPQNDFILSIIGEELGFVGILILLCVFLLLVWRCLIVSMRAPDRMGMLLAAGFGIMIGVQVILNVAVVTSSMPPTGVALPFISYGGNSLWIFMTGMGITLNISRQISGGGEIIHKDTEKARGTKRKSKKNKRTVRSRRAVQS
jgi:cell division protein FtsW